MDWKIFGSYGIFYQANYQTYVAFKFHNGVLSMKSDNFIFLCFICGPSDDSHFCLRVRGRVTLKILSGSIMKTLYLCSHRSV